jgi:hypothetical protein
MPTKRNQCCLCKNLVLKNQQIAVLALPLRSTNDNGDYGLIDEYFQKERIVHYECLDNTFPTLRGILYGDSTPISVKLWEVLRSMGERVQHKEVLHFIKQQGETIELPGLITLWFTKRNVFGKKP